LVHTYTRISIHIYMLFYINHTCKYVYANTSIYLDYSNKIIHNMMISQVFGMYDNFSRTDSVYE